MSRGNLGPHPSQPTRALTTSQTHGPSLRLIGPYFSGCFVMVDLFGPMAGVDGYIGKTQPV